MTINLSKGGNINLSKNAPGLTKAVVGLGWDARTTSGESFDLDASAILCGADGKALSDDHFVFFNNKVDPSGSVECGPDNRDGFGDGDDESIKIDLSKVPAEVDKIVIIVSIYNDDLIKDGKEPNTFGDVTNSYCRLFDEENPSGDDYRYDLREDASMNTALVYAEVYRNGADWKFRAIGQGYNEGLAGVIRDYGLFA